MIMSVIQLYIIAYQKYIKNYILCLRQIKFEKHKTKITYNVFKFQC